jgi:predicted RNA binding protein YcfA (HicA-like mRNA interferase family)
VRECSCFRVSENFDDLAEWIYIVGKLEKLIEQFLREPPEVKFSDVRYLLESFGLEERRSRGSHHTFRNVEGLKITIPKTGGRMVKGVYVRQIVKLLNLEESSDENSN